MVAHDSDLSPGQDMGPVEEELPPFSVRAIPLGGVNVVVPVGNASGSEIRVTVTVGAHVVWRATTRASVGVQRNWIEHQRQGGKKYRNNAFSVVFVILPARCRKNARGCKSRGLLTICT